MTEPSFHPRPRISDQPSGKIRHPRREEPWTLPAMPRQQSGAPVRDVECFACRQYTPVPASAVSARCGHCAAYIKLDDITLHSRTHRTNVQTRGSVTVQAHADLKGLHVECRDLVLYGRISGNILCKGICKIKTDQHISGSLSTCRLAVEKKATVLVINGIHAENVNIEGVLQGTLTATGTVIIRRNAKLLGDLTARRLVIEEGGTHHGNFTRFTRS